MDLRGAGAIVTGGASGIGAATVARLQGRGRPGRGPRRARRARRRPVAAVRRRRRGAGCRRACSAAVEHLGGLDVAIVNAGHRRDGRDPRPEHRRMGSGDARQSARRLRDAARVRTRDGRPRVGRGAIVAITSVAGFLTDRLMAHYSVSKAGLAALVRVAARELGPHGIRVNGVAPGTTDTPMFAATDQMPGYRERVAEPRRARAGRVGRARWRRRSSRCARSTG